MKDFEKKLNVYYDDINEITVTCPFCNSPYELARGNPVTGKRRESKIFDLQLENIELSNKYDDLNENYLNSPEVKNLLKQNKKEAIQKSKIVNNSQLFERFVPMFKNFPYFNKDAKHLGFPTDYIIFDGLYSKPNLEKIIFLEIKTNNSRLNSNEKQVEKCINSGNVEYKIFKKTGIKW